MTNTEEQKKADEKIYGLIEEQYQAVKKEIDGYVKHEQYELAIDTWKRFLKKFSYRNHYKETIQSEIVKLEQKLTESS